MPSHPALVQDAVAVVTGASSGIGYAVARRLVSLGLKVALTDIDDKELAAAVSALGAEAADPSRVIGRCCDARSRAAVVALAGEVAERLGPVRVLVNSAGTGLGGGPLERPEEWQRTLEVNLWGVIHSCQVFVPPMLDLALPGLVVNVGSKQGITCPPGNAAYNVSKAALKVYTEALEHELRQSSLRADSDAPGAGVRAHLLVPGWTHTAIGRKAERDRARLEGRACELTAAGAKPSGAWTSEQVVDALLEAIEEGTFYILCPDNEVSLELDRKRIAWAAGDLVSARPPLSRWHPDYAASFQSFLEE